MSWDGINGWLIQTLLRGENDSKQSDEIQAIIMYYPTLGSRGFSRVHRKFSVLVEGRHTFGNRARKVSGIQGSIILAVFKTGLKFTILYTYGLCCYNMFLVSFVKSCHPLQ